MLTDRGGGNRFWVGLKPTSVRRQRPTGFTGLCTCKTSTDPWWSSSPERQRGRRWDRAERRGRAAPRCSSGRVELCGWRKMNTSAHAQPHLHEWSPSVLCHTPTSSLSRKHCTSHHFNFSYDKSLAHTDLHWFSLFSGLPKILKL